CMPKWWNSLFRVLSSLDRSDSRAAQKAVERGTSASNEAAARRAAARAIAVLDTQCSILKRRSNNYPARPIGAGVWVGGTSIAISADLLADEMERRGLIDFEERARLLAVTAAREVVGHYPEQIFPRVLRRGGCSERRGHDSVAIQCYRAILKDFAEL